MIKSCIKLSRRGPGSIYLCLTTPTCPFSPPLNFKVYSFNSFPEYCEIDKPLALAYALAFCQEANPASVNFAFIDGYKNDIKENKYLTQVINKFEKKNSKKINFITTTILN